MHRPEMFQITFTPCRVSKKGKGVTHRSKSERLAAQLGHIFRCGRAHGLKVYTMEVLGLNPGDSTQLEVQQATATITQWLDNNLMSGERVHIIRDPRAPVEIGQSLLYHSIVKWSRNMSPNQNTYHTANINTTIEKIKKWHDIKGSIQTHGVSAPPL